MSQDLHVSRPEPLESEVSQTGGLPEDFFRDGHPPSAARGAERAASLHPSHPQARREERGGRVFHDRRPVLAIGIAVLLGNILVLLGGLLAGWALATRAGVGRSAQPSAVATPPPGDLARFVESRASEKEVGGLAAEVARLKAELLGLSRELGRVQGRLELQSKPLPPLDLRPLQERVDVLVKAEERLARVPEGLDGVDRRLDALEKGLAAVRSEVEAVPDKVKEAALSEREARAVVAPRQPGAESQALTKGAALYAEGKFAEARDVFVNQAREMPDDARLWYYAALANGYATRLWDGETERLVKQGIEREQAGTPDRSVIDAQFSDLPRERGKAWLWEWRERGGVGPRPVPTRVAPGPS